MKILFISIPAFLYSEQSVSSVSERLKLTVEGLNLLGHHVEVLVPKGSEKLLYTIEVEGQLHPNLEMCDKYEYLMSPQSSLMHMIEYARKNQADYDYIISVAQDYMCMWAIAYFRTPFLVIPNTVGSIPECDELLKRRYQEFPHHFAFLTAQQKYLTLRHLNLLDSVESYHKPYKNGKKDLYENYDQEENIVLDSPVLNNIASVLHQEKMEEQVLGEPFEASQYVYGQKKDDSKIFWAGRIVSYKGLENVARICQRLGKKLEFSGVVNDQMFLDYILENYDCQYLGVLSRMEMSHKMAQSPVFFQLQNPPWEEAFGRTTVEALFSGTAVIAFDNGANQEIIEHGVTGFIVKDIDEAISCYEKASNISSSHIRSVAEHKFNILSHARKIEDWLKKVKP